MTPAHRLRPAPTAAADPRADDDVALLRAVPEFPCPVDPRGPLDTGECGAAPPLDHACKMRFLDDPALRILPRPLDEGVQIPRTRRGLPPFLARDRKLRSRSAGFFGHRHTPWIFGFARRYISRTRDVESAAPRSGRYYSPCLRRTLRRPFPRDRRTPCKYDCTMSRAADSTSPIDRTSNRVRNQPHP